MSFFLFFIYDAKDIRHLTEIENQIKVLVDNKVLAYWHEGKYSAGIEWQLERDEKMRNADMVLPVVSANFLASDNCKKLLEKANELGKQIIPIIASHCLWDIDPILKKWQAIPKKLNDTEATPITDWNEPSKAYSEIVRAIKKATETKIGEIGETVKVEPDMAKLRAKVQEFVSNAKIQECLEFLKAHFSANIEVIEFQNRFAKNERDNRRGIVDKRDYDIEYRLICAGILDFIQETIP